MPPRRINHIANTRLHNHRSRVSLPRPPQKRWEIADHRPQIGGGSDSAFLNDNPSVLIWVCSSLCSDHVPLAGIGAAGVDVAVLDDGSGIAEDEVDGADDDALDVELAVGVDVECVLIGEHVAAVKSREVGANTESHRLVL